MRKKFYFIGFVLVLLCGCQALPKDQERSIKQIAFTELGTKFAKSFADDDSKDFIECLAPQVRQSFNEEKFIASYKEITEKFGKVESYELLCEIENPIYEIQIWKMRFVKKEILNDMENKKMIIHEQDNYYGVCICGTTIRGYNCDEEMGDIKGAVKYLIDIGFINAEDVLIIEGDDIYLHCDFDKK